MEKHSFEIWSPQLRNRRPIDVYLPDGYDTGRRLHPVVYLQDGQNSSDPSIAFASETWRLDDALRWRTGRGLEPIVVGIHNMGERRLAEYSPFPDPRSSAEARGSLRELPGRHREAAHRRGVVNAPRSWRHGHRRLVDGRTDRSVCTFFRRRRHSATQW
jgi:hypothetical protein